jgi:uncharacterized membrane protein YeaQ/YmgE (transglycosylase-associated protein family)
MMKKNIYIVIVLLIGIYSFENEAFASINSQINQTEAKKRSLKKEAEKLGKAAESSSNSKYFFKKLQSIDEKLEQQNEKLGRLKAAKAKYLRKVAAYKERRQESTKKSTSIVPAFIGAAVATAVQKSDEVASVDSSSNTDSRSEDTENPQPRKGFGLVMKIIFALIIGYFVCKMIFSALDRTGGNTPGIVETYRERSENNSLEDSVSVIPESMRENVARSINDPRNNSPYEFANNSPSILTYPGSEATIQAPSPANPQNEGGSPRQSNRNRTRTANNETTVSSQPTPPTTQRRTTEENGVRRDNVFVDADGRIPLELL